VTHSQLLVYLARRYRVRSYLEIGVGVGRTLLRVPARQKVGVDPFESIALGARLRLARTNPSNLVARVYRETSDEFFAHRGEKLYGRGGVDLVFLDGNHTYPQALADIRAALGLLSPRGVAVVHDTNPATESEGWPAESWQEAAAANPPGWNRAWCGDVWKAILQLRRDSPGLGVRTVRTDFGISILNPRIAGVPLAGPQSDLSALTFADLDANRDDWLGLCGGEDVEGWLEQDPALAG
jgi:hypothetical protein